MVMIVAHHGIVHGLGFENIQDATTGNQFGLIYFEANAFLGIAVNCFFWVSGYYQIKRRISRAVELITETMLYVLLLNVVLCLTNNYSITNFLDVIRIIKRVILFYQGYWFLSAYLIVFIFAPYLNKMVSVLAPNEKKSCMAGFVLKNTLSDNGGVTRGICKMNEQNNLTEVVVTKSIVKTANGAEADGVAIDVNSLVSMNMWGLTPDFLDVLEEGFKEFFEKEVPGNPLKAEYLIPIFIGELLEQGKMSVKVLKTNDTWYA